MTLFGIKKFPSQEMQQNKQKTLIVSVVAKLLLIHKNVKCNKKNIIQNIF